MIISLRGNPMSMLPQTAVPPVPPVPPIVLGGQANIELIQILSAEETEAVRRLVQLQGDRVAVKSVLDASPPKGEAEMLEHRLRGITGEIAGQESRIANLQQRIAALRQGEPGTFVPPAFTIEEPRMFGYSRDEFVGGSILLMMLPLAIAVARLAWRRGSRIGRPAASVQEGDRLARLEQAVEAVAIEVERIGESQRFQTRLMSEREAVTAPKH
jgi:hypothetical protein